MMKRESMSIFETVRINQVKKFPRNDINLIDQPVKKIIQHQLMKGAKFFKINSSLSLRKSLHCDIRPEVFP